MGDQVTGYRCSICAETWPPDPRYQECPQCGERTSPFSNAQPTVDRDEAESIRKHRLFDEYLEREGRDGARA